MRRRAMHRSGGRTLGLSQRPILLALVLEYKARARWSSRKDELRSRANRLVQAFREARSR
jgi:hypothetical protein